MKGLKQTLGREEPRKIKKANLTVTTSKLKKAGPHELSSTLLYRSPSKGTFEAELETLVTSIIERSFRNNSIASLEKVIRQIIQKCHASGSKSSQNLNKTAEDEELKKLEEIKMLVEQILNKNQQEQQLNPAVHQFYDELLDVIKNKSKISRKKKLQQYDRLIKLLSPKKVFKKQADNQKAEEDRGLSPNNLKVRITKQEYEIKREASPMERLRVGSEGKRVKTAGSNPSPLKSENGHDKLKKLFQKEPSFKLIKTKVQYDYSAIFEASKSKIHNRKKNLTTVGEKDKANDLTTKLNKARKNEAFVFYKPVNKHKGQ